MRNRITFVGLDVPLEKMAGPLLPPVDPASVAKGEVLHDS